MSAKKMIRAVGYARRSTDMQKRSSPDQKACVEKWAAEHGYRILRWFVDDAVSGTSAKGPGGAGSGTGRRRGGVREVA
ncbi:MAG: recombinase family protein [Phycisphaerae bacterium]|nr:recombinase family protein [Phycisphaerae bacterium]